MSYLKKQAPKIFIGMDQLIARWGASFGPPHRREYYRECLRRRQNLNAVEEIILTQPGKSPSEIIDGLRRLVEKQPDNELARSSLAHHLALSGFNEESLVHYKHLCQGEYAGAYLHRLRMAEVLYKTERFQEAIVELRLLVMPEYAKYGKIRSLAILLLGDAFRDSGDTASARATWETLPQDSHLWEAVRQRLVQSGL